MATAETATHSLSGETDVISMHDARILVWCKISPQTCEAHQMEHPSAGRLVAAATALSICNHLELPWHAGADRRVSA